MRDTCEPNAKGQMRRHHLQCRDRMSGEEIQRLSGRIAAQIRENLWGLMENVYGYYPLKSEVSLTEVYQYLLGRGVSLAFPRVNGSEMDFYQVASLEDLEEGSFHVMEPKMFCRKVEWKEAVCFVPGAVFDREGGRFGYGKGFYDRYFARYPQILRVGIAYEHQMEEKLPKEKWDIPMDYIVTEQGIVYP